MTTQTQAIRLNNVKPSTADPNWNSLYKASGTAALLILLTALAEILITFLPGGYTTADTVIDWFSLLQDNWFLGVRNLGLLNMIMTTLSMPMVLALYVAHQRVNPSYAGLAVILSFIGSAVFYATNRAFPMLDLSHQYAAATSDAQRTMIAAAGQAMLSVGQSHVPGTFLGFFLTEVGSIIMALVMLKGRIFSKTTAIMGIVGYGFLFLFDSLSSFVPSTHDVVLIFAMIGGVSTMAWYALVARNLFRLGQMDRAGAR